MASWAARVGLTSDLLERFPHEVSEGQLQRACLARALVVQPRYLICDELSSMLDVSTQAALLEAIAAVQAQRELGVLLITHDRILADTWCGEVVDIRWLGEHAGEVAERALRPVAASWRVARCAHWAARAFVAILGAMGSFALSERWNGWENLGVMVQAARAAVEAGPLDPLVCVIDVEGDEDDVTLDASTPWRSCLPRARIR